MNKLLPNYNISEYLENDTEALTTFTHILYDIVKEAIESKSIQSIRDGLSNINDRYERISNLLDIQNIANNKCYHFGFITALSTLGLDLYKSDAEDIQMQELINSYPLLLPTLEVIAKYDTISGVNLKDALGQKSSNISNFMRRIKQFDLVNVNKIGTVNYYSLTSKGMRLISQFNQKQVAATDDRRIHEKTIFLMLEEVATQLTSERPSSIPVLKKIGEDLPSIKEKQLLKYDLETVFLSRDIYMRKFVERAFSTRDDLELEEYEDWDEHYSITKEIDFEHLTEASYV